jgi:hypothetical protein
VPTWSDDEAFWQVGGFAVFAPMLTVGDWLKLCLRAGRPSGREKQDCTKSSHQQHYPRASLGHCMNAALIVIVAALIVAALIVIVAAGIR